MRHIRKLIAFSLALCFVLLCSSTVSATETESVSNLEVVDIWNILKENGALCVEDGRLVVKENALTNESEYSYFLELVEFANESIELGIAYIPNEDVAEIATVQNYDEVFCEISTIGESESDNYSINSDSFTYCSSPGHCTARYLNLAGMCEDNYQALVSYYDMVYDLFLTNPDYNPLTATTAYWVSLVKPGGDWDYKLIEPYKSDTFCANFGYGYCHITGEHIGNINYGYTGSFLFSLNTLYLGSSAVGGGPEKDAHDRPYIKAGYDLKMSS